MLEWLSRYGAYVLVLSGYLLFSAALRSAAGPQEAISGQVAPPPAAGPAAGAVRLIARPRPPGEGAAAPSGGAEAITGGNAAASTGAVPSGSAGELPAATSSRDPAASTGGGRPLPAPSPRDTAAAGAPPALPEATPVPSAGASVETRATPAATPVPALPATDRIVIPRIGVDARVIDVGVLPTGEMETAAYAAGRLAFTAQAGEPGNAVIAGHNDILGEVFRRLPELQIGDEVLLYRGSAVFRYRVAVRTIVREEGATEAQRRENARWLDPTDEPVTTLISCYPYRVDTHRIIIRARLVA